MQMLSDDDVNIRSMSPEELDLAWDLWFDLAQSTNEFDPPYTHGVLVGCCPARAVPGEDPGNLVASVLSRRAKEL